MQTQLPRDNRHLFPVEHLNKSLRVLQLLRTQSPGWFYPVNTLLQVYPVGHAALGDIRQLNGIHYVLYPDC